MTRRRPRPLPPDVLASIAASAARPIAELAAEWVPRGRSTFDGAGPCCSKSLPERCATCNRCRSCAPGRWRPCAATPPCAVYCPACEPRHLAGCARAEP